MQNTYSTVSPKFQLGHIVATPNVLNQIAQSEIQNALARHQSGDWGDLCEEDCQASNQALVDGLRILSAYRAATGLKFWIITEGDRSVTTVLLPEDY